MAKLQDDVVAKEQAKASAMRQRFEERTKRFLDAKRRTIGVDNETLEQQVEEKNQERIKQKEEGKNDAIHLEQLCNYLDERESAKQELKRRELEDVQATLQHQVKQPKNNAIAKGSPLDLDSCGPSSIQRFDGEDNGYNLRKKMQQQQLQDWCAMQRKEKNDRIQEEVEKEKEYAEYVIAEDKIRCEIHDQERMHRTMTKVEIMAENMRLAEERRTRQQEDRRREKELEATETNFVQSSPLFCEETDFAKSALSDNRVRPDHFKGFSPKKCKAIIDANMSVAAEKEYLTKMEKEREEDWAMQQAEMIQKMEEMEMARKMVMEENNLIQANTLKLQREELKEKQATMEREKFGAIGNGFFQKFGTSCR